MSKFKVGQKWRARNGDMFEIINDLGDTPFPIIAAKLSGSGEIITVDRSGRRYFGMLSGHDLLELVFDSSIYENQMLGTIDQLSICASQMLLDTIDQLRKEELRLQMEKKND